VQRRILAELIFALALVLLSPTTSAQRSFELGTVLSGASPASTAPWLTATFTDIAPGQITMTLQSHLNVSSEFIGEVALNLNSAFDPGSLTFLQLSGPALQGAPSLAEDGVKLPGAGSLGVGFDILLSWPAAHGQNRFDSTEAVSFDISGPANLTSADFAFYNSVNGQDGEAIIGAHIQGIPAGGGVTGSGAIIQAVPEPSALALFALALTASTLSRGRGPQVPVRRAALAGGSGAEVRLTSSAAAFEQALKQRSGRAGMDDSL
jgi:hypothetical protein